MRADLGYPILGGVQGWSQKQVVSGMSMTTGSWDSVANWGPAAQLVPNQATPSRSTRLTKNSVCGVRAWALGYGENREDEISPVLPSHTSRKPWPSGSGSASRLPRSQDSGQRGNLEEIRDGGGRTPKNHFGMELFRITQCPESRKMYGLFHSNTEDTAGNQLSP